jgi:acyl-homoserine lactone acylase PvdQ
VTLASLEPLFRELPLGDLSRLVPPESGWRYASNSWVVGGGHTASGKPLLENDPHLTLTALLDTGGPSLRLILDFAELSRSRFMISPGISGNPLSGLYANLLQPWRAAAWVGLTAPHPALLPTSRPGPLSAPGLPGARADGSPPLLKTSLRPK